MTAKVLGGILIVVGCSLFGYLYAANHRKEARYLRRYVTALEFMQCELQFRLTPLPELCNLTAEVCEGSLKKLFKALAKELEYQISPDVERCMIVATEKIVDLPQLTRSALLNLGPVLGRFDIEGQCKGLEYLRVDALRVLNTYSENQETRLRSYQTLGICTGAALAILFI